jgi:hypothetical protein
MCSTKCAMPPCSAVSWRDPRVSQTPMLMHLRHAFGQNAKAVPKNLSNDR